MQNWVLERDPKRCSSIMLAFAGATSSNYTHTHTHTRARTHARSLVRTHTFSPTSEHILQWAVIPNACIVRELSK